MRYTSKQPQSPERFELHAREPVGTPPRLPVLPVVLPHLVVELLPVGEPLGLVAAARLLAPLAALALRVLQLQLELLRRAEVALLQRALVRPEPGVGGGQEARVRPQLVQLHREPGEAVVALVVGGHRARAPDAAGRRGDAAVEGLRPLAEELLHGFAGLVVDGTDHLEFRRLAGLVVVSIWEY